MQAVNTLNRQAELAIEKYLPKMQTVFRNKIGSTALAAAKNDKAMEKLFVALYKKSLPFLVRLFVIKKKTFVKYCFKYRDRFV